MNDHLELCHPGRHDCSYVSLILLWRREYSGCTTSVLHFGKQIAYLEYEKLPRVIHLFEISILSYRFLFLHIVGLGMLIEYGMFGKMNMSCGITWTFPEAKWGEFSKTPFTDNLLLPLKVDAGRKNKAIWLFSWEPKDWTHFNLDTCIMPSLNSDSVSLIYGIFFYSGKVDRYVVTICRLFSVWKLIFWKTQVEYLTSCLNYSIALQYSQVRYVFNNRDLLVRFINCGICESCAA